MKPVRPRRCPGCGRDIHPRLYACRRCWRRLPPDLALAITRAWGRRVHGAPGAAEEHEHAKTAADTWLRDNTTEGTTT